MIGLAAGSVFILERDSLVSLSVWRAAIDWPGTSLILSIMRTQFALDLRTERRKSGFTQSDVAHLISSNQSLVSELEQGKRRPNLEQIVDLSIVYARSFEAFFGTLMSERQRVILGQVHTLPVIEARSSNTHNRPGSINRLEKRLTEALAYEA
ncbi:helix-turn-helix transcriptional regulator [Aestuariivita sp.]|uniref:helix-turn-helix domain-containing protein n=1 Tax=Aestuariivita sp. TaxID=1872407 RepID=UPI00216E8BEB|nr:helix-turn-helix transcriptional regulator [Aestuariivita sp.]MCE8005971.1 helix-turn-helix transcriptional regulator [Aestuariivita sp.]